MEQTLTRQEASDAVTELGWRFLLGSIRTSVQVGGLAQAADLAGRAVATCGDDADQHLRIDVRPDRVVLTLQSAAHATVTTVDVDLANRISAELRTEPEIGTEAHRSVQIFDICVPHDEAHHRMEAALAAGGRLLSDAEAPAFWVLADPEGNEACITTWQGRDS